MKRNKWLLLGCGALLSTALLQPVMAHDRGYDNGYGGPMMGGPGAYGGHPNGYGNGYGYGYDNDYGRSDRHHGPGMHHGLRQLDLNDKQEKAIHKIMRDSRADFRHLEEKIRDKRYELYELIDGSQDQARLNKLADEIGDLMAERIKLRVATRVKILQELTADQREEARDIPFLGR